jgi:hypothetical protein
MIINETDIVCVAAFKAEGNPPVLVRNDSPDTRLIPFEFVQSVRFRQ